MTTPNMTPDQVDTFIRNRFARLSNSELRFVGLATAILKDTGLTPEDLGDRTGAEFVRRSEAT